MHGYGVDTMVDGTTAGLAAAALPFISDLDPATAAAFAVSMVVVFRGLGYLLTACARYITAQAVRVERSNGPPDREE